MSAPSTFEVSSLVAPASCVVCPAMASRVPKRKADAESAATPAAAANPSGAQTPQETKEANKEMKSTPDAKVRRRPSLTLWVMSCAHCARRTGLSGYSEEWVNRIVRRSRRTRTSTRWRRHSGGFYSPSRSTTSGVRRWRRSAWRGRASVNGWCRTSGRFQRRTRCVARFYTPVYRLRTITPYPAAAHCASRHVRMLFATHLALSPSSVLRW